MSGTTQLETFMEVLLSRVSVPGQRPFVVTCDSTRSFRLDGRLDELGIPHVDVGIAEGLAVAVAAGAASEGYTAFVAAFAAFGVLRGLESLRTFVDAERLPVVLLGGMAGLSAGPDGSSHHLLEDLGVLRALDSVRIYTPSDAESCGWIVSDLLDRPEPAYVRLARVPVPPWEGPSSDGPLRWLVRSGAPTVVCGYGPQLLIAARSLVAAGCAVDVLEVRRCQPLPTGLADLLDGLAVVVVEEHRPGGGLADRIRAEIARPVREIAVDRSPGSGDYQEILRACGITGDGLVRALTGTST